MPPLPKKERKKLVTPELAAIRGEIKQVKEMLTNHVGKEGWMASHAEKMMLGHRRSLNDLTELKSSTTPPVLRKSLSKPLAPYLQIRASRTPQSLLRCGSDTGSVVAAASRHHQFPPHQRRKLEPPPSAALPIAAAPAQLELDRTLSTLLDYPVFKPLAAPSAAPAFLQPSQQLEYDEEVLSALQKSWIRPSTATATTLSSASLVTAAAQQMSSSLTPNDFAQIQMYGPFTPSQGRAYRRCPRSPSAFATTERRRAGEEVDGVLDLPVVATRCGSFSKCGTNFVNDLAGGFSGDRSWGDMVNVRPGDPEDDDTPRGR